LHISDDLSINERTKMSRHKILLCEENGARRESLARLLKELDAEVMAVSSLSQALRLLLEKNGFHLFVTGLSAMSGPPLQILSSLKKDSPRLSIIGLAKVQNSEAGIALLNKGFFDHLAAPGDLVGLYAAAKNALIKKDLAAENDFYVKSLRQLKVEKSKNAKKTYELEEIYDSTVENLMTALDLRDVETLGHSQTVAKFSQVLAKLLGIEDRAFLNNIRMGALLHDIGKIAIPDAILHKPGSLSSEEWEKIKLHPSLGYGLIKEIKLVKEIGNIILCHHERYDGTGYPQGLKQGKIPLEARIFALADALDAITAHRPYRKVRDFPAAKKEIVKNSGTQFDPRTVEAFCSLKLEKWERIRSETTSYIPHIEEFSELLKKSRLTKKSPL
jgi:putative nucleotidyltransferase with HDIG domain